jgi:hypothetical protein
MLKVTVRWAIHAEGSMNTSNGKITQRRKRRNGEFARVAQRIEPGRPKPCGRGFESLRGR